jgi:hypothetical protein
VEPPLGLVRRTGMQWRGLTLLWSVLALMTACSNTSRTQVCDAALALPSVRVDIGAVIQAHPAAHGRFCPHAANHRFAGRCTKFAVTASGSVTPTPGYGDPAGSVRVYLMPRDALLTSRTWLGRSQVASRIHLTYRSSGYCGGLVYSPVVLQADGSLRPAGGSSR